MKKHSRIPETDVYDGSQESKERLKYLFYFTERNITDFVNLGNSYKKYMVQVMNEISKDRQSCNVPNYREVFARIFKITEVENVANLTRLLFNALIAFDAFLTYIKEDIKNLKHKELQSFINSIKPIFEIHSFDTGKEYDFTYFISEIRNAYIHNGKYLAKYSLLPNDNCTAYVPGLSIALKDVFNKAYIKEQGLSEEYCVDMLETFDKIIEPLRASRGYLIKL